MVLYIEKPTEHVKTTQTNKQVQQLYRIHYEAAEVDMGIRIHFSGRKYNLEASCY